MADISLVAVGTVGDLAPIADIAMELQDRGHNVRLASNNDISPTLLPSVDFLRLRPTMASVMSTAAGRRIVTGNRFVTRPLAVAAVARKHYTELAEQIFDFCSGAQIIVHTGMSAGAVQASIVNNSPAIRTYLRPAWKSQEQATLLAFGRKRHPFIAGLSHSVLERGASVVLGREIRQFEVRLNLKSAHRRARVIDTPLDFPWPSIFAVPSLLANDAMRSDSRAKCVGFIRGDRFWNQFPPPDDVLNWIARARRTRSVALVSLSDYGTGALRGRFNAVVQTLLHSEFAVITSLATSINDPTNESVWKFENPVNHEQILPMVDLFVHNGGVGSCISSLRSGVASVAFPLWFDQPYWADVASQYGESTTVRNMNDLKSLLQGIRSSKSRTMKSPANGIQLRDGSIEAADTVESLLS